MLLWSGILINKYGTINNILLYKSDRNIEVIFLESTLICCQSSFSQSVTLSWESDDDKFDLINFNFSSIHLSLIVFLAFHQTK